MKDKNGNELNVADELRSDHVNGLTAMVVSVSRDQVVLTTSRGFEYPLNQTQLDQSAWVKL